MSSLKITDLSKVYPSGECALCNVSLEAGNGELLVILGGEKSGKSTLLRIIAGLDDPTSGTVEMEGKDVTETAPKDRNLAMVFKSSTLYPALNVYDNMAYGLRLRKASQAVIDQRVKAVSNILGLNDVLYRKPKALNAAAKQRVAIGRALAREPKLYLFDEPLAGLDENLRLDMLNLMVNLQARMEGSFIYATKNLSEAMTIGTRIAVLKQGLLQQIDTPANLYDYPANTYVAFYIGSPTINLVYGCKIVKDGEKYFIETPFARLEIKDNILKRFADIENYAQSGREIILGLRPEDAATADAGIAVGQIGKTESADGQNYCEWTCGKTTLIVKRTNERAMSLDADLSRLYIFDGKTRLTLLSRDDGYKDSGLPGGHFVPLSYEEEENILKKPLTEKRK